MTPPHTFQPRAGLMQTIFRKLRAADLVAAEQTVNLTLAHPDNGDDKHDRPTKWHTDPSCTPRKVHMSLTYPVESLLLANSHGPRLD